MSEPELGHHRRHPRQRLGGTAATEDDEVVGIGDDMSTERIRRAALRQVLQEPVHVDVGEQWAATAALRRAAACCPCRRSCAGFRLHRAPRSVAFSHILMRRSTFRSTTRRATDLRRSECGIESK